jgi:hypothetical protein
MISGRKPMISIIIVRIGTESGGRKPRCSQSCRQMISGSTCMAGFRESVKTGGGHNRLYCKAKPILGELRSRQVYCEVSARCLDMPWTMTSLAHMADHLWNLSTVSNVADETGAKLVVRCTENFVLNMGVGFRILAAFHHISLSFRALV